MSHQNYVLYHANCPDGFGAAYAAWCHLQDDAIYIPVQYGQEPPEMEPRSRVYIVDFSYPRDTLIALSKEHFSVNIIDHHASAEKALSGIESEADNIHCMFDMEHSGAILTWDWFFGIPNVPELLYYVEDRDLWKWSLPQSKEVSISLSMIPKTFVDWNRLCRTGDGIDMLIERGKNLLEYQSKLVQDQCKAVVMRVLCGYTVPIVNTTTLFSECGELLCVQYPDAPFAAYYMDRKDGLRQWGLRSRNGFDCTTVAVQMGGGGHPGASGFTTELGWLPPLAE